MILSVLMPCLSSRDWRPLARHLEEQAAGRRVEVLCLEDTGECTSGYKREALLARATGDYVCFVDDDDWVRGDYVETMLEGISHYPDVVTIEVDVLMFRDSIRRDEHWSLRLSATDDRARGIMSANHLCAWRRDIAGRVAWHPQLGYADDQLWYKPLVMASRSLTERHVDKPVYRRRYDPATTVNQRAESVRKTRDLVGGHVDVFRQGPEIFVQHGFCQTFGCVMLRDRHNTVREVDCRAVERVGSLTVF